ncbi:MAG: hypothetical protein JNJ75_16410 [Cyclobacteriaceae bacterium]|nr:hypothetical protein [Cyclobacteriaceae bacterium]
MKFLTRTLSLVTVASLALFFANCGGDGGGGSAKEKTQLKKLSGTWEIVSADLDGDDRTADFTNFKLTIGGTYNSDTPEGPYSFSVSGSRPDPSPWPASGTWTFANISGNEGNLLRDDDVPMHYKITSNGQLTLEVECAACDYPGSGARTFEVNGPWTFVLDPQ